LQSFSLWSLRSIFLAVFTVLPPTGRIQLLSIGRVKIRTNSIVHNAQDQPPSGFDDPAKVQAGARAFSELGCINCHGAPGVKWAKFSEGLQPDPPDLKDVVREATPSQLFWVIKNGINMTGMPSFAAAGAKDDELWSVVAFLKKLPSISDDDYKTWTAPQGAKQ
jgi:mono/diheme cytochrome c family protein